jgi:hypothetical protein
VNDTITLVALAAAQPIPEPASLTLLVGTLWFGLAPSSPHTLASPQRDDVGLENPARVAPDCLNLLAKRHEFERIVDCGVDPVIVPISPEEAASAIDTTATIDTVADLIAGGRAEEQKSNSLTAELL